MPIYPFGGRGGAHHVTQRRARREAKLSIAEGNCA